MDIDQLQDSKYRQAVQKLHKAKKHVERLLPTEMSEEGRKILIRYINTCADEIKNLRMGYILSMRLRSDCINFYDMKEREAHVATYYLDFGNGILSAPMTYREFLERVRNANGKNKMENLL